MNNNKETAYVVMLLRFVSWPTLLLIRGAFEQDCEITIIGTVLHGDPPGLSGSQ